MSCIDVLRLSRVLTSVRDHARLAQGCISLLDHCRSLGIGVHAGQSVRERLARAGNLVVVQMNPTDPMQTGCSTYPVAQATS